MGRFVKKTSCPSCGSSDALALYDNDTATCFSCKKYFKDIENTGDSDTSPQYPRKSRQMAHFTIEEIESFPIADLSHRGIKKEVCAKYGIRMSVDEATGEPKHIFFPAGVGQGYKRKNLKDKNDQSVIGKYKGLFGQNTAKSGKMLVITEGEEDALAVYQMFQAKGKDYKIVSLPDGANKEGQVSRTVLEEMDYLKAFEGIMLCFDSDKPGQAMVEGFAEIFAGDVKIKVIELPLKDANCMLLEGRGDEFYQLFWSAKEYKPELVVRGEEIDLDFISTPIKEGYQWKLFPKLHNMMHGWRRGELTTVLAPPNVGKSTFVAELGYDFAAIAGEKTAYLFLEENLQKATQRLVALDNNVPLPKFRINPDVISREDRQKTLDKLFSSGVTKFISTTYGAIQQKRLLPLLKYYHYVEGCTRFIFDHVSLLIASDKGDNERKMIDTLLQELAAFVTETNVCFVLVAHIKRVDRKIYAKDKNDPDVEWLWIDMDAARGSGGFEQMSHNIIALEPQHTEEGERGLVRISIKKNREWGFIGPADIYKLDQSTGRLKTVDLSEQEF